MKKLILIIIVVTAAWQGFAKYRAGEPSMAIEKIVAEVAQDTAVSLPARQFRCDGRTHCSQMTSCAEATFFLRNCPGVKMDGNNDGIPCERQWCSR
ncbi:MAG: excalibur calcium-binding domain-containing protein [Proteobacteria bacterium]|nr:excalibur calcium-binding domain-containing protein [Pseudomonadota bacterium]